MKHPYTAAVRSASFVALALAFAGFAATAFAGERDLSVAKGRLDSTSGNVEVGSTLRVGASYAVTGLVEARVTGASGASFRALPGTRFLVLGNDAGQMAVRLDEGVIADATGGSGILDIATSATVVRGDRAMAFVRVLPRGVYAEHQQGSTGKLELRTRGSDPAALLPGTFRMLALDGGDAVSSTSVVRAPSAAPAPVVIPAVSQVPVASVVPAVPTARSSFDVQPVPCAPVTVTPPAVCAPPPLCGPCGEWVIASDVPVPSRADDTGRPPLGQALGDGQCCGYCCTDTICNKIPYVHYVEGLVCDVSTYKVGCTIVTIRPASRVRTHRLPDGSLEIWAPNIGKDLALIEVNDNQFCYIGEDGFLVLDPCGTVAYFRGLVHLYTRRDRTITDHDIPKRREITGSRVIDEQPVPRAEVSR